MHKDRRDVSLGGEEGKYNYETHVATCKTLIVHRYTLLCDGQGVKGEDVGLTQHGRSGYGEFNRKRLNNNWTKERSRCVW